MKRYLRRVVGAVLAGGMTIALAAAGCSNNPSSCSAPSSGKFTSQLSYTQTVPVDLFCDGGTVDASSCSAQPHPFAGASWTIAVSSGSATITSPQGTWSCTAIGPGTAPSQQPDGSTQVGTGCYLLLECGEHAAGDAGTATVQVQILAQGTTDVVALVHQVGGDCCTDQYTGSWH